MKRIIGPIVIFCYISIFMIACQDSISEYTLLEEGNLAETRAEYSNNIKDYYWFNGKKLFIKQVENKSFVLFKEKDNIALSSALSKSKIRLNHDRIHKFKYNGTDMSGNAAKSFQEHLWAEIDIDDKTASEYEKIVYSAPFYKLDNGDEFPLTNMVYVTLKDDGDLSILEKITKEYNVGIVGKIEDLPRLYIVSCTKESEGNALYIANKFYESGFFESAEPAFISLKLHGVDPLYYQQWNLNNTGQNGSNYSTYDINYAQATSIMSSSNSIIIAIVDSGVELTHSDLNLHSFSWDAITSSSPSQIISAHGTAVAGVAAAIANNSKGIKGVAAGYKIMSLSIDTGSSLATSQAALAIKKAADQGASIINCSWSVNSSQLVDNAISYAITNGRNGKGCVIVISAGNHGLNSLCYPASHTPETDIISVGAISFDGKRKTTTSPDNNTQWGSDYGTGLDIVAPGVNIPTTVLNDTCVTTFWGTSAAAPHVSGIAAHILAKNSDLSYKDVSFIINRSANKQLPNYSFNTTKIGGSWNSQVGYGLLDAYAAISLAQSSTNSGSAYISGQSNLTADSNGYAGTTLTAYPNSTYTYIWSGIFYGQCDRWYLWPSGGLETGANADVSVYLNPGQTGGTLVITCRIYNSTSYIGTATHYLIITP